MTDTIFVINSKRKNINRKNKCKFFIKKKFKNLSKKLQIFLLKFFDYKKLHLLRSEITGNRLILKTPLKKKIGFPKFLIQEIVEALEIGLMLAQKKKNLPSSAAPAPVARWRCPRAAPVASSLPTPCWVTKH